MHHGTLVGLLLLAVGTCGCGGKPSTGVTATSLGSQAELLAAADVVRDDQGQVIAIALRGGRVTDKSLEWLRGLPALREVTLQECRLVSDAGLAVIADVPSLELLRLIRVPISDDGLRHVARATQLKELSLAHTHVVGGGLHYLSELPLQRLAIHSHKFSLGEASAITQLKALRELELDCPSSSLADLPELGELVDLYSLIVPRTPLGDGGWFKLLSARNLRRLTLVATAISDEQLASVSQLPELQHLALLNGAFSDDALAGLQLPRLKTMTLNGCKNITDKGLRKLAGLGALEELDLCDTSVQGRDFSGLAELKNLRKVILTAAQFQGDDDSIRKLQSQLPGCEIQLIRG